MHLFTRTRPRGLIPFIAFVHILIGYGASLSYAQQSIDAVRIEAEEALKSKLINDIPLTGSLTAARIATLSAEVSGLISGLNVDIGDQLNAGDTLLELDDELAEIALQRARASASSARERLQNSERRLAEAQRLGASNSIAASEVRSRQSQAQVDKAALAVTQAEVSQREAELRRHRVTVPFSGTLSRKLVEIGEWVDPGTGLLEIISAETLYADFQVSQGFYPRIDDDTKVSLRFDVYPNQTFPGQVLNKVPQSNDGSRTFLLRVALIEEHTPPMLIAGMSVNATLRLASGAQGVTVSRDALMRYPDGRVTVWIVSPDDGAEATVTEHQVEIGLSFDGQIEITSGLDAGQQVVTRGNESLRENQRVTIINSLGR